MNNNLNTDDSWKQNTGIGNGGIRNLGNNNEGSYNVGDGNTGRFNIGDENTGEQNIGDSNIGWCNRGYGNKGFCNYGSSNTGDHNTGSNNTGDWNGTNHSTGCFNTKEECITLFNKPSSWTYNDWEKSSAKKILDDCPCSTVAWVPESEMGEEEKAKNPSYKCAGGYLKEKISTAEDKQRWWDNELDEDEKEEIMSIPNFDKDIFKEITGINV